MTIKEGIYPFSQTTLRKDRVSSLELNSVRSKAILEQNYMSLKGLDDELFKTLSEKSFKEAKEVTYELIEEDNENPYL
ncbi:MAG: hypothetical protein ACFFB5_14820 [Promethearchaeota archaeon]